MIYAIGAVFVALIVGLTVACMVELSDLSVRSAQQLRRPYRNAPTAMIPQLTRRSASAAATIEGRGSDPRLNEAIRGAMLALESADADEAPRSIVVTSAHPGDGASLVAAALAFEYAASKRRVLLIECNPRPGRARFPFGDGAEPGLSGLLGGEGPVSDYVRHDRETGIDYLPWGAGGASLFHDRHMIVRLLQEARRSGQLVIFDCAPILTSSETVLLAGLADRGLLVLRWGKTGRSVAEAATERLHGATDGRITLAINMVRPRRHALYGFDDRALAAHAPRRPRSVVAS